MTALYSVNFTAAFRAKVAVLDFVCAWDFLGKISVSSGTLKVRFFAPNCLAVSDFGCSEAFLRKCSVSY
jgi:hypothetical protein